MTSVCREVLLQNGQEARIVIPEKTLRRLDTTCFRGAHLELAGNFHRWEWADDFMDDKSILDQLTIQISEALIAGDIGTNSVTLAYGSAVGWASTSPLAGFRPEDLEAFQPNRRSTALRVRPDRVHLRAPQTSELTVIFELRLEEERPVGVVHSIYPGQDIGELNGDVSAREEIAFFDWKHPGV